MKAAKSLAPSAPARMDLHSRVLNEDRAAWIRTPPGYAEGKEAYPVLFIVDGESRVNAVNSAIDLLADNGRIPQMIVAVVASTNAQRRRDLVQPNGCDEFLRFMKVELIPQVEQRYRTRPLRILAGDGAGGVLVIHALAEQSSPFGGYIALSPSWTGADSAIFGRIEQSLAHRQEPLKAEFFFAAGDRPEMRTGYDRLHKFLSTSVLPAQFRWGSSWMEDEDPASMMIRGYTTGLRRVFADFPVQRDGNGIPVGGLTGLEKHYRDLSDRYGYVAQVPEDQINDLGYRYMQVNPPQMSSAIAALRRNVDLHPDSPNAHDSLGEAYFRSGQNDLAVANGLKAVELANTQHDARLELFEDHLTLQWMNVAAMQAWLGQEADLANTLKRAMEHARGSPFPQVMDRAIKMAFIRPGIDRARLEECLDLARRNVKGDKNHRFFAYFLMTLGMGEYRNGNYPQCDAAMIAAVEASDADYYILTTSSFYRAMSLFHQGKPEEARALAHEALCMMSPSPADLKNPMADGAGHEDLFVWMAAKEALALLKMPDFSEGELNQRREAMKSARRLVGQAVDELSSGRSLEGTAHLAAAAQALPYNTELSMTAGSLSAWFGQDAQYAASVHRMTDLARDTHFAVTAERAAKLGLIRSSTDTAQLNASVALGRRAMELGKADSSSLHWFQLAQGMAEYRADNYAAADELLRAAAERTKDSKDPWESTVPWTSSFYRAMSLHRQGKESEAQALFADTAAKMKPFPLDQANPLGAGLVGENLIAWMAFKEAGALLNAK